MRGEVKTLNANRITGNKKQALIIIMVTIILIIVFSILRPAFFSADNFNSILLTMVPVSLVAIGECILLIGGGLFDLSVGMVASLSALCAAAIMKSTESVFLALMVGWGVGIGCGAIAGLSVSRLGMNAFISTFALQQIYRGIVYIWTGGFSNVLMDKEYTAFNNIGQSKLFGNTVQTPIVLMIIIFIVVALFMKYSRVGRSAYLIGSNIKASKISGINVKNIQLFMFMFMGFLAAMAGILLASRTAVSQPFVGEMYAMEGITAAVVGGTSMLGGKGNIIMTFLGVFIVYIIKNGLVMIGVSDYVQYIAIGLILFVAMLPQVQKEFK